MELKVIQVVIGLGVPGLSLGIFYLLLKGLKWDLNKKGPRTMAALFMLLITSVTWYALYLYAPKPLQPYRILITVLNESGIPLADAQVTADSSEQVRLLDKSYELVVRDRDRGEQVTFFAERGNDHGTTTVELKDARDLRATIQLKKRTDGEISGRVVDPQGNPLAGVSVTVLGFEEEAVTDENGFFRLNTHGPPGALVRINAVTDGLGWSGTFPAEMGVEVRLVPK